MKPMKFFKCDTDYFFTYYNIVTRKTLENQRYFQIELKNSRKYDTTKYTYRLTTVYELLKMF